MNSAAMNIQVLVFVWACIFIFLGDTPRNGITGSYGKFMLSFFLNWLHDFTFAPAADGFHLSISVPVLVF